MYGLENDYESHTLFGSSGISHGITAALVRNESGLSADDIPATLPTMSLTMIDDDDIDGHQTSLAMDMFTNHRLVSEVPQDMKPFDSISHTGHKPNSIMLPSPPQSPEKSLKLGQKPAGDMAHAATILPAANGLGGHLAYNATSVMASMYNLQPYYMRYFNVAPFTAPLPQTIFQQPSKAPSARSRTSTKPPVSHVCHNPNCRTTAAKAWRYLTAVDKDKRYPLCNPCALYYTKRKEHRPSTLCLSYTSRAKRRVPPGGRSCSNCGIKNTPVWRGNSTQFLCNACGQHYKKRGFPRPICMASPDLMTSGSNQNQIFAD
jgi:hypothetical protein